MATSFPEENNHLGVLRSAYEAFDVDSFKEAAKSCFELDLQLFKGHEYNEAFFSVPDSGTLDNKRQ
jgi:hypothetical protein